MPLYGHELTEETDPLQAGLGWAVKFDKGDFIGREAALAERDEGPRLLRVSLAIEAENADVMGDEPIWALTADDWGAVAPGHGFGAPRFDAAGAALPRPDARVDGDWRVVGWVTSGGYGHAVGLSLAQGYLPAGLAGEEGDGVFEVEILGVRRPARILAEPPFDPDGARMRG
jgi:dimethylglycine dehydrogenase